MAIADFNKAIELRPKFCYVYFNRADIFYIKGEYDKAWEDVYKLQSLRFQVDSQFLKDLRKASRRQR